MLPCLLNKKNVSCVVVWLVCWASVASASGFFFTVLNLHTKGDTHVSCLHYLGYVVMFGKRLAMLGFTWTVNYGVLDESPVRPLWTAFCSWKHNDILLHHMLKSSVISSDFEYAAKQKLTLALSPSAVYTVDIYYVFIYILFPLTSSLTRMKLRTSVLTWLIAAFVHILCRSFLLFLMARKHRGFEPN